MAQHSRKPWSKFVTPENQHLVSPEGIDLLVRDLVGGHSPAGLHVCLDDELLSRYEADCLCLTTPPSRLSGQDAAV